MHRILFGAFFLLCILPAAAQNEANDAPTSMMVADDDKMFDHFVGVQANLLIQQIFNFGEPTDANNPYLLKYTLRHNNTGLALNFGAGVNSVTSENNEGFKRTSEMFDTRVGLGYQKTIGNNFEMGVGADFVYGYDKGETFSIQVVTSFGTTDSTVTTSIDKTTSVGGGLQASFAYVFAKRFTIGTEMSFYYLKTEEKFNVTSENFLKQQNLDTVVSVDATNESAEGTEITFQVPISIFLAFKF